MTKKFLFIALFSTIFSINASYSNPTQELLRSLKSNTASVESVKKNVTAGADINVDPGANFGKLRPLHYATQQGLYDIAAYLIDQGAELNPQTHYGETPLSIAIDKKNIALALLLIEKGADVKTNDTLFLAIHYNLIDLIVPLVEHGANLETKDNYYKETPLYKAVACGTKKMAEKLLSLGADVNAKNRSGHTPLHIAVIQNNFAMVQLLLHYKKEKDGERS